VNLRLITDFTTNVESESREQRPSAMGRLSFFRAVVALRRTSQSAGSDRSIVQRRINARRTRSDRRLWPRTESNMADLRHEQHGGDATIAEPTPPLAKQRAARDTHRSDLELDSAHEAIRRQSNRIPR